MKAFLRRVNERYDELPESPRLLVMLAPMVIAGLADVVIGLVTVRPSFLIIMAVFGMLALRLPYIEGWLDP